MDETIIGILVTKGDEYADDGFIRNKE